MLLADGASIQLALGVHAHQPLGNAGHVLEDAYQRAYLPFLEVLERHPLVRVAYHHSGPLLQWLEAKHPDYLDRLASLTNEGQVEWLGGAFHEPFLPALPERDQLGQLRKLRQHLTQRFGQIPLGAWLAGRVWEPHLPKVLVEAGVDHVMLDDAHFEAAGLAPEAWWGHVLTEDQGKALAILPIRRELRARIPFAPPELTVEWLRAQASPDGARLALVVEDLEKFGGWPGTYQAVYVEGWLERFFALLETHADWIRCTTPGTYVATHRPWGRAYLPSAAQPELMAWALPPERQVALGLAKQEVSKVHHSFLRGGHWRHFLVRYPEANWLHQRMLWVGSKVEEAQARAEELARLAEAEAGEGEAPKSGALASPLAHALASRELLWQAQGNDPYWHGVFGGIYLNHLRSAHHGALAQALALAQGLRHPEGPFLEVGHQDLDLDGQKEWLLDTRDQSLVVVPSQGGALAWWELSGPACNLLSTLARRHEAYHGELDAKAEGPLMPGQGFGPKEGGLGGLLAQDWYQRWALLDHFFHPDTSLESLRAVGYGEQGDFVDQPFRSRWEEGPEGGVLELQRDGHVWVGSEFWPLRLHKRLSLPRSGAGWQVEYRLSQAWDRPVELWFGVEFNLNLRGAAADPEAFLDLALTPGEGGLLAPTHAQGAKGLHLRDQQAGWGLRLGWDQVGELWRFPVETVSRSEAGYERVYQGSAVVPHWKVALGPKGTWSCKITAELAPR